MTEKIGKGCAYCPEMATTYRISDGLRAHLVPCCLKCFWRLKVAIARTVGGAR